MLDTKTLDLMPYNNNEPICGLSKRSDRRSREIAALWLVSQGHTLRIEIQRMMAIKFGIDHRSGALMAIIPGLINKGFLYCERQPVPGVKKYGVLSLDAVYFTDSGRDLVDHFVWSLKETELKRMKRLHEKGKTEKKHTAAVLAFTYQARIRGWSAGVMPDSGTENNCYAPDVIVVRDNREYHVEIELSWKTAESKWRNLARYRELVAICAKHELHQQTLVNYADSIIGAKTTILATNLRSLFIEAGKEPTGNLWQYRF